MPKFTYTGESATGEKVTQVVEADDRFAVYEIARTNGHTVSKVKEVKAFSIGAHLNLSKINYLLGRVKADDLVIFTRNLASMLKAGLPLSRVLSVIERQSTNAKLQGIVKQLRERINKGDQFHEGLGEFPKTFSQLYVSMVKAGEESGGLAESLQTLSVQLERSSSLRKKIKSAMIYPVIILFVMVIIAVLMMIYVMPSIIATFESLKVDLPTTTKILIATSNFVNQNALLTILVMIVLVVGFIFSLHTSVGKKIYHYVVLRIPIIGKLAKETNAARTARTLSSLLRAGVEVITAINITEDVVQNVYYKKIIKEAAVRVEKGNALSEIFIERSDLYPVLVGEMISVGEETGDISSMLSELAEFYESEVEQKTKDMSTIVEPFLMVVIGLGVGFFALAMIAPIYSISDSI